MQFHGVGRLGRHHHPAGGATRDRFMRLVILALRGFDDPELRFVLLGRGTAAPSKQYHVTPVLEHLDRGPLARRKVLDGEQVASHRPERCTERISRALSIGLLTTRGRAVARPTPSVGGQESCAAMLARHLFHNAIHHVTDIVTKLAYRPTEFKRL